MQTAMAQISCAVWSEPLDKSGMDRNECSTFHISSVIRQSFSSFQNNPKHLDPSYKMDLDL